MEWSVIPSPESTKTWLANCRLDMLMHHACAYESAAGLMEPAAPAGAAAGHAPGTQDATSANACWW